MVFLNVFYARQVLLGMIWVFKQQDLQKVYRRLLIGRDGHLDQSEAYDISNKSNQTNMSSFHPLDKTSSEWKLKTHNLTF